MTTIIPYSHYMMTISCQQKKHTITYSDLLEVVKWIKHNHKYFYTEDYSFEQSGKYAQLHYHSIVRVHSKFRYRPFTQYGDIKHCENTFHINWKLITNYQGARDYIHKDLASLFVASFKKKGPRSPGRRAATAVRPDTSEAR